MSKKIQNYQVVDIDKDTGEIINKRGVFYSEEQIEAWNARKQREKAIANGRENTFVWFLFTQGEKIFSTLSSSTITRLFYLATYCGYDGYLVDGNYKKLTKRNLSIKLNLSENATRDFWKDVTKAGILEIDEENHVRVSNEYFDKGRMPNHPSITRVYCKFVREIYESCTNARQHKVLSYAFRLIPFVNFKHNIVCANPAEQDIKEIRPLRVYEFCEALGTDFKNGKQFIEKLLHLQVNGEFLLTIYGHTLDSSKHMLFVNPRIFYAGGEPIEIRNEFDSRVNCLPVTEGTPDA